MSLFAPRKKTTIARPLIRILFERNLLNRIVERHLDILAAISATERIIDEDNANYHAWMFKHKHDDSKEIHLKKKEFGKNIRAAKQLLLRYTYIEKIARQDLYSFNQNKTEKKRHRKNPPYIPIYI